MLVSMMQNATLGKDGLSLCAHGACILVGNKVSNISGGVC